MPPTKIVRIDGKRQPDLITDSDFKKAAALQDLAWKAHVRAWLAVDTIHERIKAGGTNTSTDWYLDSERRMVRSRKKLSGH